MTKRLALVVVSVLVAACGSSSSPAGSASSPTGPPSVAPTRIIDVTGDLAFGDVNFGESPTRTLTVANSGNGVLTFTGINAAEGTGTAGYSATPTTGTVPPGGSVPVTIRFTPTIAQLYSNVLTVVGDQTSGKATINLSGTGIDSSTGPDNTPVWTQSGTGDKVFDMPTTVARVRIQAAPTTNCQNFVVLIAGASTVNVILGTCEAAAAPSLDGTYLTGGGGAVSITISTGITWTFTEIR
jgi:HYDIN/CFA65/VesB family protein